MAKPVRHKDGPSTEISVDVQPSETSGDLSPTVARPEEFRRRADEIADSIGEVADQFRLRLAQVLKRPHDGTWGVTTVEIEFGIAIKAEVGVLVVKASGGSTFTAKLILKNVSDTP